MKRGRRNRQFFDRIQEPTLTYTADSEAQFLGIRNNDKQKFFVHKEHNVEALLLKPIHRDGNNNPKEALKYDFAQWVTQGRPIDTRYRRLVVLLRGGSGYIPFCEGVGLFDLYIDLQLRLSELDPYKFATACIRKFGYKFDDNLTHAEKIKLFLDKINFNDERKSTISCYNTNLIALVGLTRDNHIETTTVLDKTDKKLKMNNNTQKFEKTIIEYPGWRVSDLNGDGVRGAQDDDDFNILNKVMKDVRVDFFKR